VRMECGFDVGPPASHCSMTSVRAPQGGKARSRMNAWERTFAWLNRRFGFS